MVNSGPVSACPLDDHWGILSHWTLGALCMQCKVSIFSLVHLSLKMMHPGQLMFKNTRPYYNRDTLYGSQYFDQLRQMKPRIQLPRMKYMPINCYLPKVNIFSWAHGQLQEPVHKAEIWKESSPNIACIVIIILGIMLAAIFHA